MLPCLFLYRFFLENTQDDVSRQISRDISHLIIYNSFFTYNNQFYRQCIGVPIGGTMPGIIAEIVICHKEQMLTMLIHTDIKLIIRYVDDVFIICDKAKM